MRFGQKRRKNGRRNFLCPNKEKRIEKRTQKLFHNDKGGHLKREKERDRDKEGRRRKVESKRVLPRRRVPKCVYQ